MVHYAAIRVATIIVNAVAGPLLGRGLVGECPLGLAHFRSQLVMARHRRPLRRPGRQINAIAGVMVVLLLCYEWNASGLLRRHVYAFCRGPSAPTVKGLEQVLHRGRGCRGMQWRWVPFQVQDVFLLLEIQFRF